MEAGTSMDTLDYMQACQLRANQALERCLPNTLSSPRKLHEAMNYSVFNGGKRVRAAFVFAVGEAFNAEDRILDEISAAIEIIHAFSLIHDDLPALDNDNLRRGKQTCHKVFGDAVAILAGDALQSLSFNILANLPLKSPSLTPDTALKMIDVLTHSIGSKGMAGGEIMDLEFLNKTTSVDDLDLMYKMKTGRLISASVILGALAANINDPETLELLDCFGENIGIAFQIHDDIIGLESSTEVLGKCQGNDLKMNKPIYPVVTSIEKAKQAEIRYVDKAMRCINSLKLDFKRMKQITHFIINRHH